VRCARFKKTKNYRLGEGEGDANGLKVGRAWDPNIIKKREGYSSSQENKNEIGLIPNSRNKLRLGGESDSKRERQKSRTDSRVVIPER